MDVLIIGAGAAGLIAARELSRKGKSVTILEARNRTGGRIHTIKDPVFELPVEEGAEFVHGDLECTLSLLKEAGIEYYKITGDLWRSDEGKLTEQKDFIEDEKELIQQLKSLQEDMSVKAFLDKYFGGEKYEKLRNSLTSFVEGYDAADAQHASSFALLQELVAEDNSDQYRLRNGYTSLIIFLYDECIASGCTVHLSAVASSIKWQAGKASVTTTDNRVFEAQKIIVTVPVPVLQAKPGDTGYIHINPLPPEVQHAIHSLGCTGVIKIILQFSEAFWKEARTDEGKKSGEDIGFVFSDAAVPTWWTQLPEDNAMITGWLAGPESLEMKDAGEENILQKALRSLAKIFSKDEEELQSQLVSHYIANWTKDPFTRGAYVYEKVESKSARRILNTPLENTLFFAGEGVYEGPERGTVEAALKSGLNVAAIIS